MGSLYYIRQAIRATCPKAGAAYVCVWQCADEDIDDMHIMLRFSLLVDVY